MATRPTLGGTELPHPNGYIETRNHRGTGHMMADGTIKHQYTALTKRRTFTLTFAMIPNTGTHSYNNIEVAWDNFPTDADGAITFLSPNNESIQVTKDPNSAGITFNAIAASGVLYWSGTMSFIEV